MKYEAGDLVKVTTPDGEHTGIVMPNKETDGLILKLDSGYNIGIDKDNVSKVEVLEKFSEKKDEKKTGTVKIDKNKPVISILHTGGTIASKVDYRTGGVVARFSPEELMKSFPELENVGNIRSKLISNMFSEDMRLAHFSVIAKAVVEEIKEGCEGVIITHGTDTMGYSSAALSFMLENVGVPVILVGAQRSSDRGSSDAGMNLICAAEFISKSDFSGLGVCMHENTDDSTCVIIPGTKTRKLHSSRRDAFKSVNGAVIARVDYSKRKVEMLIKDYSKKGKNEVVLKDKMNEKVGIMKVHPNITPEQILFYKGYKGLIIEGTGLGHLPINETNEWSKGNKKNLAAVKEVVDSGCTIVMTSQTIFGRVQMHVYSTGRDLLSIGVIPGEDMLTETAFIKLSWLLGNYDSDKAKKMMKQNLRGEINERLLADQFIEPDKC